MELLCPWEAPQYFIFSSNVPTLLHYSHFVAILAALVFVLLLLPKVRQDLISKVFVSTLTLFIAWVAIDVLLWASNRADLVLFYWSLQVLLEVLVYAGCFYLTYVFVAKKHLTFSLKAVLVGLLLPIVVLLPTTILLPGIDISYCNAIESNFVILYTYVFEALIVLAILGVTFTAFKKQADRVKEIGFFITGLIVFLVAFSSGNIVGSLTEDWALAQIGLFGMPVFIAFLAYTVVKFKSFNLKIIGTQALVATIWLLTLAILFIRKIENVRIVVFFTLALFTFLGYQLIKSVKKEIEAKEALGKANIRLQELDKQKTEFVSFATHQLRSPLTAMKGNMSLLLEGDLGPVTEPIKNMGQTVYTSIKTLINIVEDYLNMSRIELGTMKYNLVDMDFKDMVKEVSNEQKPNIEAKGLKWSVVMDESLSYKIKADPDKFKQVLMNTIDNSIKYTPSGSLTISLEKVGTNIRFKVADTGVGIRADVMPKLFQKFSRAPKASEANIHGTGLGLFIAREIMNAHGGRIWAESEGEGKGSQFIVELPEVK